MIFRISVCFVFTELIVTLPAQIYKWTKQKKS